MQVDALGRRVEMHAHDDPLVRLLEDLWMRVPHREPCPRLFLRAADRGRVLAGKAEPGHVGMQEVAQLLDVAHHRCSSLYNVSRCTGMRPASLMNRTSSGIFCSVPLVAPAAWKIFSRTTVP